MTALEEDKSGEQLQVAIQDDVAYVRLRDRGSFKISKTMKQFGVSVIDQNIRTIVVDMSECVSMDSTFMGVIAGLAFRLKKKQGRMHLVNLSSRTRGLLSTLGLDQLVETSMAGATSLEFERVFASDSKMQELASDHGSQHETAEMMLEAHEDLVRASPENRPRFKDVLTFLREDINNADPGPGGATGA